MSRRNAPGPTFSRSSVVGFAEPKHDSIGWQLRNGCFSSTAIGAAQRASLGTPARALAVEPTSTESMPTIFAKKLFRGLLDVDVDRVAGENRRREGDVGSGHAAAVLSAVLDRERPCSALALGERLRAGKCGSVGDSLRVAILAEPGADVDHRSCGCKKNRQEEDGERRSLAVFASHDHSKRSVVTLVRVPADDGQPENVNGIRIRDGAADVAAGRVPVVGVAGTRSRRPRRGRWRRSRRRPRQRRRSRRRSG